MSPDAKDLIHHLLEKDVVKRYTATSVLSHPWITRTALQVPLQTPTILKRYHHYLFGTEYPNYLSCFCSSYRNPSIPSEIALIATTSNAFNRTDSQLSLPRDNLDVLNISGRSDTSNSFNSQNQRSQDDMVLSSPEASEIAIRRIQARNSDEAELKHGKTTFHFSEAEDD